MNNEKNTILSTIQEQVKIVLLMYFVIVLLHYFFTDSNLIALLKASMTSFLMVALAITLKNIIKKPNLPGFAWGTLVAFFLTLPVSPLQKPILEALSAYQFTLVGLPLLAFAGISVGEDLQVFKKLSWKIVIISFVVMASTYFGSALIAQLVMYWKGVI